jgi:hypothetical protein
MSDGNKGSPVASVAAVLEHLRTVCDAGIEKVAIRRQSHHMEQILTIRSRTDAMEETWHDMRKEISNLDALLAASYEKAGRDLDAERAERARKAHELLVDVEARQAAAYRKAANEIALQRLPEL